MAGNFFWYELATSDTAAAQAFYGDVVGWTLQPFAGGGMDYTILAVGERGVGGMMAMPDAAREGGGKPGWVGYIAARDVDAAAKQLSDAGGTVLHGPDDIPGVGRFAAVADPQGARFMLMAPGGEDRPPLPAGTPGTIGWRELATDGARDASDFYAAQFGWSEDGTFDMGPMGLYRLFAVDGVQTGGIMDAPPGMSAPRWTFYFTVADLGAALDRVRSGGGIVINGPMEVPGGSRVALCSDPQGASFALLMPPG